MNKNHSLEQDKILQWCQAVERKDEDTLNKLCKESIHDDGLALALHYVSTHFDPAYNMVTQLTALRQEFQ
jgi:hypothetical protein